jgi:crotonobetainyl-CoA:carnitine CoA-transferase CaiB-like acyl-CoA transferase
MACAGAFKVSDVMANPHTKARGAVIEVDYPGVGPVKAAANPIKLSDAPVAVRRKSPGIGEHTIEIMHEVGYSDAEIAALREAKAVGVP